MAVFDVASRDDAGSAGRGATAESPLQRTLVFMAFGAGSGWIVVGAVFMEITIYQDQFGLKTSNRMALGYTLGAWWIPVFAAIRSLLLCFGRDVNYPLLIVLITALNVANLAYAAAGITSLDALVAVSFVGGSCGYLAGVIHQAYLVTRCGNELVAVFWTGDSASGVIASVLALAQRPELAAGHGRRFSPHTFYLTVTVFMPIALAAFLLIERRGLGALASDPDRPMAATTEIEFAALPTASAKGSPRECNDAPLGVLGGADGKGAGLLRLIPGGACARPGISAGIAVFAWWLAFLCWGLGDSAIPYACQHSSASSEGSDACLFHSGLSTVFALLVGSGLAALPAEQNLRLSMLYLPGVAFSVAALLLLVAAWQGGAWARPFGASADVGSAYIIFLVGAERLLNPFLQLLMQRMVQKEYDPEHWEGMNMLFLTVRLSGNMIGVAIATAIVG